MNRLLLGEISNRLSSDCIDCTLNESLAAVPLQTMLQLHADPFQSVQLPEVVEEALTEGVARSISFNRHGTILAGAQMH